MSDKTFLFVSGPSCAGKSTILKKLLPLRHTTYYLVADRLKKYIANYDNQNELHVSLKTEFVQNVAKFFLAKQFSLIIESSFAELQNIQWYRDCALNHGYAFIHCHIKAPKKVLLERFNQRMTLGKSFGLRYSAITEHDYLENYSYGKLLLQKAIEHVPINYTFDSSLLSADEVVQELLKCY